MKGTLSVGVLAAVQTVNVRQYREQPHIMYRVYEPAFCRAFFFFLGIAKLLNSSQEKFEVVVFVVSPH